MSPNPIALARRAQIRGVVYLLLDRSASMADKGKMQGLYQGALNLFTEARRRDYAVGIVAFDDRAELVLRATCDGTRFWSRLARLEPYGHTAMHRGIRLATRLLRRKAGERTILLVTDGMPDDRQATLDAARLARAEGITLIAIGIGHADEAFLSTLTLKPELAEKVATNMLAKVLGEAFSPLSKQR